MHRRSSIVAIDVMIIATVIVVSIAGLAFIAGAVSEMLSGCVTT